MAEQEQRQVRSAQPLSARLPGPASWKAQGPGNGKAHTSLPHPLRVLATSNCPTWPWTSLSVTVSCKRSSAVSISAKLQKKKKKKGQALRPAVGEAAFSTDDDDSQCPSWRLELGVRLGRLGTAKGKPQFPSTPGPAERRCLSPTEKIPVPGCGNTAPPADHPETQQDQEGEKPLPGASASCKAPHGVQADMLGNQAPTSKTPRDPTILLTPLASKEELAFS